ncbi:MAG: hypothetical protein H3C35_05755 [Bacteroidetes bacterium]|nr:hypothetical protein [Bacteroidota bacterium]
MKRLQSLICCVILAVQLATSVVTSHFHSEDYILPAAHPIQTLVNHDDALNCRHEPLSQEKYCLLSIMLRISLQQSPVNGVLSVNRSNEVIPEFPSQTYLFIVTTSQSHRGPPAAFA